MVHPSRSNSHNAQFQKLFKSAHTLPPLSRIISCKMAITQGNNFSAKYLYLSLLKQNLLYQPSNSGSFMGRASYSASRIFSMRDDSRKRRLTSYSSAAFPILRFRYRNPTAMESHLI